GGLGQRQLLGALLEVRARRLLDAVGAVPEVDGVEVCGEDPVLAPPLLELPCQRRLTHLACECLLVPDVGVLHELLCDRRASFDDSLLAHVLPEGTGDTAHVYAVVLEEALILDRDDRLSHDRRDVLRVHEDAALVASKDRQARAPIRRVDHRVYVRVLRGGIERRYLARDRADEAEREGEQCSGQEDEQQRRKTTLANPASRPRRPLLTPNPQGRGF